ncbi:CHAT domain-containing protein [Cochleicola gelatinilyticus]|uniref:CHAT domain-containing protein n=1 Tax=Cochleicola gelatinilyticus TaxID=1763537 RepID=A0A167F0Z9_9FLAO|nr:CHAT domain-containing protein [Cochleicola gelatinilyticus]OAB76079.1 hypothetical protein ULVI_13555 [Cochleicola gelatinilyticus]
MRNRLLLFTIFLFVQGIYAQDTDIERIKKEVVEAKTAFQQRRLADSERICETLRLQLVASEEKKSAAHYALYSELLRLHFNVLKAKNEYSKTLQLADLSTKEVLQSFKESGNNTLQNHIQHIIEATQRFSTDTAQLLKAIQTYSILEYTIPKEEVNARLQLTEYVEVLRSRMEEVMKADALKKMAEYGNLQEEMLKKITEKMNTDGVEIDIDRKQMHANTNSVNASIENMTKNLSSEMEAALTQQLMGQILPEDGVKLENIQEIMTSVAQMSGLEGDEMDKVMSQIQTLEKPLEVAGRLDTVMQNQMLRRSQEGMESLKTSHENDPIALGMETLFQVQTLAINLETDSLLGLYPKIKKDIARADAALQMDASDMNLESQLDFMIWAALFTKEHYTEALPFAEKIRSEKGNEFSTFPALIATHLALHTYRSVEEEYNQAVQNTSKDIFKKENVPMYLLSKLYYMEALMGQKKYKEALALEMETKKEVEQLSSRNKSDQHFLHSILNKMNIYSGLASFELGDMTAADHKMESFLKNMNTIPWIQNMGNLAQNFVLPTQKNNDLSQLYVPYTDVAMYYLSVRNRNEDAMVAMGYNSILFYKELTVNLERKAAFTGSNVKDTNGDALYMKWIEAREKASDINYKNRDSIQDYATLFQKQLMSETTKNVAQQVEVTKFTWKDIQEQLQPSEAAIEFVSYKSNYLNEEKSERMYGAFVLTPSMTYPVFIELCKEATLKAIFNPKDMANSTSEKATINTTYNKNSFQAYALIWNKIEPYLTGTTTVFYAPSGMLHTVAFAALRRNNEGAFLNEKYTLHQVSTTQNIPQVKKHFSYSSAAVFGAINYNENENLEALLSEVPDQDKNRGGAFWKSLDGTKNEVATLEALLTRHGIRTQTFIENNALEENFYHAIKNQPDIVHVATHAFYERPKGIMSFQPVDYSFKGRAKYFEEQDPMNTAGLVFTGANYFWKTGKRITSQTEDGIVTANELASLDLSKTNLVILSACETALGNSQGNEGIYGIQRGLKLAGAKNLIVSLWKVDDLKTAEFMKTFYSNLIEQKGTLAEAFITSRNQMQKLHPDPYYWAAFILIQ